MNIPLYKTKDLALAAELLTGPIEITDEGTLEHPSFELLSVSRPDPKDDIMVFYFAESEELLRVVTMFLGDRTYVNSKEFSKNRKKIMDQIVNIKKGGTYNEL